MRVYICMCKYKYELYIATIRIQWDTTVITIVRMTSLLPSYDLQ